MYLKEFYRVALERGNKGYVLQFDMLFFALEIVEVGEELAVVNHSKRGRVLVEHLFRRVLAGGRRRQHIGHCTVIIA